MGRDGGRGGANFGRESALGLGKSGRVREGGEEGSRICER